MRAGAGRSVDDDDETRVESSPYWCILVSPLPTNPMFVPRHRRIFSVMRVTLICAGREA